MFLCFFSKKKCYFYVKYELFLLLYIISLVNSIFFQICFKKSHSLSSIYTLEFCPTLVVWNITQLFHSLKCVYNYHICTLRAHMTALLLSLVSLYWKTLCSICLQVVLILIYLWYTFCYTMYYGFSDVHLHDNMSINLGVSDSNRLYGWWLQGGMSLEQGLYLKDKFFSKV